MATSAFHARLKMFERKASIAKQEQSSAKAAKAAKAKVASSGHRRRHSDPKLIEEATSPAASSLPTPPAASGAAAAAVGAAATTPAAATAVPSTSGDGAVTPVAAAGGTGGTEPASPSSSGSGGATVLGFWKLREKQEREHERAKAQERRRKQNAMQRRFLAQQEANKQANEATSSSSLPRPVIATSPTSSSSQSVSVSISASSSSLATSQTAAPLALTTSSSSSVSSSSSSSSSSTTSSPSHSALSPVAVSTAPSLGASSLSSSTTTPASPVTTTTSPTSSISPQTGTGAAAKSRLSYWKDKEKEHRDRAAEQAKRSPAVGRKVVRFDAVSPKHSRQSESAAPQTQPVVVPSKASPPADVSAVSAVSAPTEVVADKKQPQPSGADPSLAVTESATDLPPLMSLPFERCPTDAGAVRREADSSAVTAVAVVATSESACVGASTEEMPASSQPLRLQRLATDANQKKEPEPTEVTACADRSVPARDDTVPDFDDEFVVVVSASTLPAELNGPMFERTATDHVHKTAMASKPPAQPQPQSSAEAQPPHSAADASIAADQKLSVDVNSALNVPRGFMQRSTPLPLVSIPERPPSELARAPTPPLEVAPAHSIEMHEGAVAVCAAPVNANSEAPVLLQLARNRTDVMDAAQSESAATGSVSSLYAGARAPVLPSASPDLSRIATDFVAPTIASSCTESSLSSTQASSAVLQAPPLSDGSAPPPLMMVRTTTDVYLEPQRRMPAAGDVPASAPAPAATTPITVEAIELPGEAEVTAAAAVSSSSSSLMAPPLQADLQAAQPPGSDPPTQTDSHTSGANAEASGGSAPGGSAITETKFSVVLHPPAGEAKALESAIVGAPQLASASVESEQPTATPYPDIPEAPLLDIDDVPTVDPEEEAKREAKRKKDAESRSRVHAEIISTETAYVKHLGNLIEHYVHPLIVADTCGIPQDEVHNMFSNVELLFSFHRVFLADLEKADNVAKAILRLADFLKMYTQYCAHYARSMHTINKYRDNKKFQKFLLDKKALTGFDVFSYLIMPVQRIPRYELLLKEMKRYTPDTHVEFESLCEAYKKIKMIATHINEENRKMENMAKLVEVQARILGELTEPLLKPDRSLVREGQLSEFSSGFFGERADDRQFFLFSDLCIWTTVKCKFEGSRPLQGLDVENFYWEKGKRHGFALKPRLREPNKKVDTTSFVCQDEKERDSWVSDLRWTLDNAIDKEEQVERRRKEYSRSINRRRGKSIGSEEDPTASEHAAAAPTGSKDDMLLSL